jgi:hypothetical protein
MRGRCILGIGVLALFSGCQACSDCSDYTPPVAFTAPGEVYADTMLPAGAPVVPQVLPPGAQSAESITAEPTPALPQPNDAGDDLP